MKTNETCRKAVLRVLGVVLIAIVSMCGQDTGDKKQAAPDELRLGPKPQELTAEQKRDSKHVADTIARLFQEGRKQVKLPRAWRFHCSTMQKVACSSAQSGRPEASGHPEFQVMYWTDKPEASHPELERIAAYDTRPQDHGGFSAERFSVVVWPTSNPKGYWIGIDLHPNALAEAWHELKAYVINCDGPCPKLPIAPVCQQVK